MAEMPQTSGRAAATSAISEAGAALMDLFQSPTGLETWFKEPGELLTASDLRLDQAIRDALTAGWPVPIVPEEGERPDAEMVWLVDPLCGTFPFSRGMDHWGVNIALRVGSQLTVGALSAPSVGETFVADASGVTRNGEPFTLAESTVLLEGSQGPASYPRYSRLRGWRRRVTSTRSARVRTGWCRSASVASAWASSPAATPNTTPREQRSPCS
jgi:myo-inositol-1(or 4)-monophosphatase